MRPLARVLLLVVAFLSGAVLMGLEIVGSRVLAINFGGSVIVWGSLIGVFLAALSVGYYLGGRLADRTPQAWALALCLLVAGGCVLLIPRYGTMVSDAIALRDLGDRTGPLLACTALFFLPGMLMGVTSPYVIRLTAQSLGRVGSASGVVYAVSTIGSIAGTLGTAFYLLSWLGTNAILYLLGGLLVLTAAVALAAGRGNPAGRALASAAALLALLLAPVCSEAAQRVLQERDSPYHRLVVVEDGDRRYLRANNLYHSVMYLNDRHGRGLPYADYMDIAFVYNPGIKRVLVIGLGGGTVPKRFVRDYPQVTVDVVEIDAEVIKIADRFFEVKAGPRLKIHEGDGRMFLRRTDEQWDMIVLDAYYADSVPFFLCTKEFFEIARSRLRPGGVLVNNVIGQPSGDKSKFVRSVYRTMRDVFPQVHAYRVAGSNTRIPNIEMFALRAEKPLGLQAIRERAIGMQNKAIKDPQLTRRLRDYLGPLRTSDVPLLTDDYAPVDALIHLW
jgi:spermidine synthase